MRPRGQTPRMRRLRTDPVNDPIRFNEAAGADPADAYPAHAVINASGGRCFNEAAGADPADAIPRL